MTKKLHVTFFLAGSIMALMGVTPAAAAQGFDPNYVLSDVELLANDTMTQQQIQQFIEDRGGYISNYSVVLDTGERVLVSDLISRAAQTHRINPRFLIALLQKEQSLIEDRSPQQSQLDWATGYGCLDGQACNERWRGIHKQINSAAEQFRYYYEHISEYRYQPSKASLIDGQTVVPQNVVTAALYNYTPHLAGNRLLRTIWDRYFIRLVPDGTLVQISGEKDIWLIQNGAKRRFASMQALVTRHDPKYVVGIGKADLDQYPQGLDIEFAAYALLRGMPSGTRYLLTIDAKRAISSDEVFRSLGFNPEEMEDVADARLDQIPAGRPVTLADAYPTGALMKDASDGALYYVESGRKYAVPSQEILAINYPGQRVTKVSHAVIARYGSGLPVSLRDGTLVKGSGSEVYVISNGAKRHITSEDVFRAIGYSWKNIVVVSDSVLDQHLPGVPLTLSQ